MKTVTLTVEVKLTITAPDDAPVENIVNELDYDFTDTSSPQTDVKDMEIIGFHVHRQE